uniref:Uncharacterized protein n=1 Tax=Tanacetum cinerariifolium TaxID=118510 RepID=A0A6L2P058_TANCI|nr:hypothetical protein [Tanacetum cinerariifolium]
MFIKYLTNQIPLKKSRGKAKKKTYNKRKVKKKVTLSAHDNIIFDDPNAALELAKSISQTEAEEAEAAKKVHATHTRIVTASVPESAKKKSSGRSSKSVVIQDNLSAPKLKPATSKTKLKDEDDIYKYKIRVRKDEDEEMINAKVDDSDNGDEEITDEAKADAEKTSEVKDDAKKTELPSSSSSLSVSSVVQESPSTATATTLPHPFVSTTPSIPQQTTTPIFTPTITTNAQTVTIAVPESNTLTDVKLRVAKLEKYMSKLKTVDHSTKELDILKNLANHRLYHALMEALIDDENAMDKGVVDTIQDHKRKHDDEDPLTRPNQGKKTKRRRTKESESSKKPSSTKDTPKGKAITKGSKTSEFASTNEPVEETIAEVVMDDAGHRTVAVDYFFNNDLEYLKTYVPEVKYTSSITKTKAARYEIKGIEDMVPTLEYH